MNKYEKLFVEILKKTKDGSLHWKQLRRHANSELIFNANHVFRQFSASFERGDETYVLFLIEKKYSDPAFDFEFDKYRPEILIVDEHGELVTTLTDSVIELQDMIRLADLVEASSDKSANLFGQL